MQMLWPRPGLEQGMRATMLMLLPMNSGSLSPERKQHKFPQAVINDKIYRMDYMFERHVINDLFRGKYQLACTKR